MIRAGYPPTRRLPLTEELHGHRVADPYRWLEDPDTGDSRAWTADQDERFRAYRDELPGRDRLAAMVSAMLDTSSITCPIWRGQSHFFLRRNAGQQHPVFSVAGLNSGHGERVLIDPMELDPSGRTSLAAVEVDKEGRLVAFQLSCGGDEEASLWVMDVATRRLVDGPIDRCRYSPVAWLPGGNCFYYVRQLPPELIPPGEGQYHRRVYLHRVGTPSDEDAEVFGRCLDRTAHYTVAVCDEGRWLTVTAQKGAEPRNDMWIADLMTCPAAEPVFRAVQEGTNARIDVQLGRDGRLYIFTDRDAPRGRLAVADPAAPQYEYWRELIPEDTEATLRDIAILDGPHLPRPLLMICRTRHAIAELTVHDLESGAMLATVPLPGLGSIRGMTVRPEGGPEVWLRYVDHVTPGSVLCYDARTQRSSPWVQVPGDRPDVPAATTHTSYRSEDGTEVRMFVIAPPGPPRPRPTILYGYGGFGVSLTPVFSAEILTWVEAGGTYAIANLRGGGEKGEDWHRAGMGENKHKAVEDLHAAAQALVAEGWTTPAQLAISGSSNGGLVVGSAMVQRPELYAAVHCGSPLLDMVRYERFGMGRMWVSEYGSAEDPRELAWLLSYSPYHHVREGVDYPATLLTVSDADTRVDPLHARKMAAALQYATSGAGPILLRREPDVGHGQRSVGRTADLISDVLAFCAHHTGLAI